MDLPVDPAVSHHWFATELNNFAWSLLERGDRDRESVELMVHASHACHYHWSQVGTDLNRQRSYCLLASVYAFASRPTEAVRYAESALEWTRVTDDDATPFDRAVAHACASQAFEIDGQNERAAQEWSQAERIADTITDQDDLAAVDALYGLRPTGSGEI